MKTLKLRNITPIEASGLMVFLGGRVLLYRDAPLLNPSQIDDVITEIREKKPDCIIFDYGALFDRTAYEIARDCVDRIKKELPGQINIVIFNIPSYEQDLR